MLHNFRTKNTQMLWRGTDWHSALLDMRPWMISVLLSCIVTLRRLIFVWMSSVMLMTTWNVQRSLMERHQTCSICSSS